MKSVSKMTRRTTLNLYLMVVTIACLNVPAHAEWSTYQGDVAHSGYVPGNIDASNLTLRWTASVSQYTTGGMVVGGGRVYSNNGGFIIEALNEQNGSLLWTNTYNSSQALSISAPAFDNGMVYYQTVNGTSNMFHGVNALTGTQVFATPYAAQFDNYLNPTPYNGNVYTGGGYYGGIYSYNGTTGAQNWFGYEGQDDGWTPSADGKYIYSFTASGHTEPTGEFRMINPVTGTTTYLVTDTGFQSYGHMGSAVVLGTHNDAFGVNGPDAPYPDATAPGRLLAFSTQADATHTPHIAWVLSGHYTNQPTLANGVLYVDDGGKVDALDELTGSTLWSWTPPSGTVGGTLIATDNVLFVSTTTSTYALDLTTHQADWSYSVSGNMAYSDGILFIDGTYGTLYTFATPEPSSIGFVILGFGLLMRSRRRD